MQFLSFAVWKNNFLAIQSHNEKYEKKLVTFKLKMMKYGDSVIFFYFVLIKNWKFLFIKSISFFFSFFKLKLDQYIPVGINDRLIEATSLMSTMTSTKQQTIRSTTIQIAITKAENNTYKNFKSFLAEKFSLNY